MGYQYGPEASRDQEKDQGKVLDEALEKAIENLNANLSAYNLARVTPELGQAASFLEESEFPKIEGRKADYSSAGEAIYVRLDQDWGTKLTNKKLGWIPLNEGIANDTVEHDDLADIRNVKGTKFRDLIVGDDQNNTIRGLGGDDYIGGFDGNDRLFGNKGDDDLFGGKGDDRAKGGKGDDFADGGEGMDTLVFSGKLEDYVVDLEAGIVKDLRKNKDGTDTFVNFEYLEFQDQTISASVPSPEVFTLELLHFADQEANAATIDNIDNLSGILNALRAEDLGDDGVVDNTLTLSSGDAIIPGLFFDASEAVFGSQGIADIQIQNELGVQAIALGNHEFDLGTGLLAGLIDGSATGAFTNSAFDGTDLEGADFEGALFPYLSANLDFSTDPNLAPLEAAGGQDTATLQNVVTSSSVSDVNGEKIGIIGATVPTIRSISSPGDDLGISPAWASGTPTDEELDALALIIQAEVDQLLTDNPDMNKVILLSHMQQISIEQALAARLENVDIIVAGGSNTRLFDDNDRVRDGDSDQGQYPQFITNAGGTTTAVVNTDGNYKYVGRLVVDFDEDGNIIPESYDENISGAYATDDQGIADLGAEDLIDPEIDAITDAIQAQIVATESNVFGVSDVFLNGNRSGTFAEDDPDGVRTQETNLGNLTADANLAYANQVIAVEGLGDEVVISVKNGGGIRANIGQIVVPAGGTEAVRVPNEEILDEDGNVVKPEGGISQNDIATTLAFNNGLTLLDINKAEIKAFLEGAVSALPTGVSGGFPQISGLKFSFDETRTAQTYDTDGNIDIAGERVLNAGIFDADGNLIAEIVRDGAIVGDPAESFRMVTLNFLANAGDEILSTLSNPNRVDLIDLDANGVADDIFSGDATFAADGTEQDALAEYLDDNFNPAKGGTAYNEGDTGPDTDGRIQNITFREDTIFDGVVEPSGIVINEVLGSTTGVDSEYIELFGEPGDSLAGLSLIVVESDAGSSNGTIDRQFDFPEDAVIGENGYFLVANGNTEATYGVTPDASIPDNWIENSSYTIALVETASIAGDIVTGSEIVIDTVGVSDGEESDSFFFDAPVIGPDGSFLPAGVGRVTDGVDTDTAADWSILDFNNDPTVNTPTSGNTGGGGGVEEVAIFDIQGAGHTSTFEGKSILTSGVVTAVDSNGFYMQDPEGDDDIATSDGIFVFTGSTPAVSVGDAVNVEASVAEFTPGGVGTRNLSTTQLVSPVVTVTGTGVVAATIIGQDGRIPPNQVIDDDGFGTIAGLGGFDPETDGIDFFESLEGMLVTAQDVVAVAGTNRFGEIFGVVDQGDDATGLSSRGTLNISPDDFNPEKIQIDFDDGILDFEFPVVNVGDQLGDVTGVVTYSFGNFEIAPTVDFTSQIISAGLEAETTELAGSEDLLTVASYNVLNLDPNDGDGDADLANGRFTKIAEQIVNNLGTPDIIALQEIQDNSGSDDNGVTSASKTLQLLALEIDKADDGFINGSLNFEFIDNTSIGNNTSGGQPGGNIRTAFLFNSDRVDLVEDSVEAVGDQNAGSAFEGARLPLVASFNFEGDEVTIVNNHFSSKGGSAPILGVEQPFDQRQEDVTVNGSLDERQVQAAAVADYVDDIVAENENANVIVLGDLNEFEFISPVSTLEASGGGLTNLVNTIDEDEIYSFVFQGNSQSLDHILVSDHLADGASFDFVHVNSEFAETDQRASDHDPLLAQLDLSGDLFTV
ncbi:5'-nucleotidase C-terminal domain-containing protein [Roseibium album]|uniref:Trifunctional nucleotide phosphoesterase protein YfkN n=1 Tax=Roseibium album TaxID=311410 RepID=A0A0M7AR42_9HYPH|nr:5'-nucleotidase C-terminal domain-containing protein [Roseibium album]CTQ59849.1 Trifunctional nucleotide phosphoesterase protein YfkN precursor [Roseibium album]CTQ76504.1 Trifunctional nucleotide phosphoesterase protein YfkN precursor [Roseibium album]CTQ76981.1 Trifunctional nucleotide phosphoesterase protein YfkN precursor [Roseibium album]